MYRILHVINNNVALVKNQQAEESVVMGSGIAFQKKKGDLVIQDKIDKVFRLNTSESKENFFMLLKDVPLDFITVTYDVIDTLVQEYDYPVQDYLYVTLTDHIYCSYQTLLDNTYQESKLLDNSGEYNTEYQMAQEALQIFRERLSPDFPDDEIGRIALHFINAKRVIEKKDSAKLEKTKELLILLENELRKYGIQRNEENSHFYDRFMIHLGYFLKSLDREEKNDESLLDMENHIQSSYPTAYEIATTIYQLISRETGASLYQSERIYIALHIQRLL